MTNLRIFGKIGILHVYKKKIKAKLDNRGIHCMFVGYSKDHDHDVYYMLKDILWFNKSYGAWKGIKEDKMTKILISDESISYSESSNPKIMTK